MEPPIINIINLGRRQDRKESVIRQMEMEKAPYKIWEAIETNPAKIGINKSHKMIVRWAKENNLPFVINAEDDLYFTGTGAYQYFIFNLPKEFDIYLGGSYAYSPDEDFKVKKFSGTTLMAIHSKYYDIFLSLTDNVHLDNILSITGGDFRVCPKVVCKQTSGYSDNVKKEMNYDYLWKDKPIYK